MKCDRCKKDTYSVYITENYERLCGSCCDNEEQKKKKRNEIQPLKETRSYEFYMILLYRINEHDPSLNKTKRTVNNDF